MSRAPEGPAASDETTGPDESVPGRRQLDSQPTGPVRQSAGLRKERRARDFVQVWSTTVRDASLSFRARGVLVWLLDHPEGWQVRASAIAKEGTEGRDAIESALRELRAAGYYRLERRRLPDGSFVMGSAVSEQARPEWIAESQAADGRAVPVRVLPDGAVVEEATETGISGTGEPGIGKPGPGSPGTGKPGPFDRGEKTDPPISPAKAGDVIPTSPRLAGRKRPSRADGTNRRALEAEAARAADQRRHDAAAVDRRARQQAISACVRCSKAGYLPSGKVCDHDPETPGRAARGLELVRAELAKRTTPSPAVPARQVAGGAR